MKKIKLIIALILTKFVSVSIQAQGFQNLNFEQANPVVITGSPLYPYAVTATSALPSWTVTLGGVPQTAITENDPSDGSPWVSLVSQPITFDPSGPIDGRYSVFLQGTGSIDAAISQTGLFHNGTQSFLFDAQSENGVGSLDVLVGGQAVPIYAIGSTPNYTLYGANISAWAGQTEQLTIDAISGFWVVDDISFSTQATPEPNIGALALLGGLLFAARKGFARDS